MGTASMSDDPGPLPDDQALRYRKFAGVEREEAEAWWAAGVGPVEAWRAVDAGVTDPNEWRSATDQRNREEEPASAARRASAVVAWREIGVHADDIDFWERLDLDITVAGRWISLGFDLSLAEEWDRAGFRARTGLPWAEAGLSPDTALRWRAAGFDCGDTFNDLEPICRHH